ISRRIALAIVYGLAPLFGKVWLQSRAMEWTYVVILAILIPMAFFCILPLLVAVIGGWVARHFGPSQPTMGAGFPPRDRGAGGRRCPRTPAACGRIRCGSRPVAKPVLAASDPCMLSGFSP